MNDETEWGPWIEHDGKGCPVLGKYCHMKFTRGPDYFGIAGREGGQSWDWSVKLFVREGSTYILDHIVSYRVRKDKGMQVLREILREVEKEKKEPAHV